MSHNESQATRIPDEATLLQPDFDTSSGGPIKKPELDIELHLKGYAAYAAAGLVGALLGHKLGKFVLHRGAALKVAKATENVAKNVVEVVE